MNTITSDLILSAFSTGQSTDPIPSDNYDPTLKIFEQMIDNIVLNDQKNLKAQEQEAVEKSQKEAEIEAACKQKIAFLDGAVQQAQAALAGVTTPPPPPPVASSTPPAFTTDENQVFQESQVAYWKAKLSQAALPPDGITEIF